MHLFQLIAHTSKGRPEPNFVVVDLSIPNLDSSLVWIKTCGNCLNLVNTYTFQKSPSTRVNCAKRTICAKQSGLDGVVWEKMTHMHCFILNIIAVVFMASEKMLQVFIIISLCELKKTPECGQF